MSVTIKLSDLSMAEKKMVQNDLRIEHKVGRNKSSTKVVLDSMFDFNVEMDSLTIPFWYAKSKFQNAQETTFDPDDGFFFDGTLRPHQHDIIAKSLPILMTEGCVIISAYTGAGKTVTAIKLACILKKKTLIICNKIIIIQQWVDTIKRFVPSARVQVINSKTGLKDEEASFFVINAINISKMDADFYSDMDFVIIDELHQIITPKLSKNLFFIKPKLMVGLSATPYRSDGYNAAIDWFFGKKVVGNKLYKAHKVFCINTRFIPEIVSTPQGLDWNRVLTSQATNDKRNELIVDVVSKFSNRTWLILVKRLIHAELLGEILKERKIPYETLLGDKIVFDKTCKVLIGTTSKIGVGFDHAAIDSLLIATDVKEYFVQFLGRCMRRPDVEPIVVDIVDNFKPLIKNFNNRLATYKEHGGIVKTITM